MHAWKFQTFDPTCLLMPARVDLCLPSLPSVTSASFSGLDSCCTTWGPPLGTSFIHKAWCWILRPAACGEMASTVEWSHNMFVQQQCQAPVGQSYKVFHLRWQTFKICLQSVRGPSVNIVPHQHKVYAHLRLVTQQHEPREQTIRLGVNGPWKYFSQIQATGEFEWGKSFRKSLLVSCVYPD